MMFYGEDRGMDFDAVMERIGDELKRIEEGKGDRESSISQEKELFEQVLTLLATDAIEFTTMETSMICTESLKSLQIDFPRWTT